MKRDMHDVWRLLEDLIHQEPSFQPLIQLPLVPKVSKLINEGQLVEHF